MNKNQHTEQPGKTVPNPIRTPSEKPDNNPIAWVVVNALNKLTGNGRLK